jgi:hypothetical protein
VIIQELSGGKMAKKTSISSSSIRASGKSAPKRASVKASAKGKTSRSSSKPSTKQETKNTIAGKTGCALPVLGALLVVFVILSGFSF